MARRSVTKKMIKLRGFYFYLSVFLKQRLFLQHYNFIVPASDVDIFLPLWYKNPTSPLKQLKKATITTKTKGKMNSKKWELSNYTQRRKTHHCHSPLDVPFFSSSTHYYHFQLHSSCSVQYSSGEMKRTVDFRLALTVMNFSFARTAPLPGTEEK